MLRLFQDLDNTSYSHVLLLLQSVINLGMEFYIPRHEIQCNLCAEFGEEKIYSGKVCMEMCEVMFA